MTGTEPPAIGNGGEFDEVSYVELARREQAEAVRLPLPNPPLLPFHELHPEVFERVVAEIRSILEFTQSRL